MVTIQRGSSVKDNYEVFDQIVNMGHEQVVYCYDEPTGLKAIIAIHDTTLGPALGGTRIWNYQSEAEALRDVLRLSRGMTYKSAISGIDLGGGKAVIIGDRNKLSSPDFWRRYGQFINTLGGRYYTAEDVGTSPGDMNYVAEKTKFVTGIEGAGGDPSPVTAYGVYLGMKASAKYAYGNDSLLGKSVLVEGVGHVGTYLIDYLTKEGAKIYITDINIENVSAAASKYNVEVIDTLNAINLNVNIYAPCALGATLNGDTIPQLKCDIIAGAANNQLEEEMLHGLMLKEEGIFYAPDFLINAGGVINCFSELAPEGYNREDAFKRTETIYDKTLAIFEKAESDNISTHEAALKLAEERIENAKKQ